MANIRIDTRGLTYTLFWIPGHSPNPLDGADDLTVSLAPGIYSFQQISGHFADFQFEVTQNGLIEYDSAYEQFLGGRGTDRLVVKGFTVTLDGRSLSHSLMPKVVGARILKRDQVHELTLVPSAGYSFHPGSGINADFQFTVTTDGRITIDPRYADFAEASQRTLTIHGYRITIDGRGLPHDLVPMSLLDYVGTLPRDRVNELTLVPAATYVLRADREPFTEFHFNVATTGEISPW